MFDFLKEIDYRLFERYKTLEKNIKSASNTFYDAYLDLQEQFLRIVLEKENVQISSGNSSGSILRNPNCKELFVSIIGLDEYTYGKMCDYAQKVNQHKHEREKRIALETVINYTTVIYNVAKAYASFKNIICEEVDFTQYGVMFGSFERENNTLRLEHQKLQEEITTLSESGKLKDSHIEALQSIASVAQIENLSLEEQNSCLQKQISILKDIKLSSMEEKLNSAIDMLLSLQSAVAETRAVGYAVGDTICGREMFKGYVERAKEEIKNS